MYNLPNVPTHGAVLGLDPGSTSMGISAVDYVYGRPVLIANAVMVNPIKGLTKDLINKKYLFMQEIAYWVETYNIKSIAIERFQSRGLKGTLIEEISMMIGFIIERYSELDLRLYTAATWKNQWHRQFSGYNLKDLYKVCRAQPHQLDATLIALHHAQKQDNTNLDYNVNTLIEGVALRSVTKTINRKLKSL